MDDLTVLQPPHMYAAGMALHSDNIYQAPAPQAYHNLPQLNPFPLKSKPSAYRHTPALSVPETAAYINACYLQQ